MVGGFGMWEMIFIFLVILLLFGAKKLPEIGSALGKGIREFKSSVREIEHEFKAPDRQIHRSSPPPTPAAEDEEDEEEVEKDGDDDGEPRSLSDQE
ncbi:MAG: twin-arginine translocase TatA/TatE family subunit [Gemmatimonadetes bacterium]|nr:twin-arginine translocase TatA/TatE family subunit [Gemmatimonadota bacterium]